MTRQTKTPRQRAEERLAVAERAVERLAGKVDGLRADLEPVEEELRLAVLRRDYLATNPDLPQTTTLAEAERALDGALDDAARTAMEGPS